MSNTLKKTIFCLMVGIIVAAFIPLDNDIVYAANNVGVKAPKSIVVKQSGKKSLKLKWSKVKGAVGYEIHKGRISLGGYRTVKTLKRTSWIAKNVGAGKRGTYKVRAYTIKKGKKIYGDFSYPVSAKVCTKKDKKRNASYVKIHRHRKYDGGFNPGYGERVFNLGYGESVDKRIEKINVNVFGPKKKGSQNRWEPINERVRFYSTNPTMVKIKSATDICAGNKTGKCYIYAIAHNGIKSNMIPVYVKDYAYEKVNIEDSGDRIQILFNECEDEIRELCSYYSQHNVKERYRLSAYYGDDLRESGILSDKTKWALMKELLKKSPFRKVSIIITPGNVIFEVPNEVFTEALMFSFNKKVKRLRGINRELSPHWAYLGYEFRI